MRLIIRDLNLKVLLPAIFTAALALVLALASQARPFSDDDQDRGRGLRSDEAGNLYGPGMEGAGAIAIKEVFTSNRCPEMTLTQELYAPAWTGSVELDRMLAAELEAFAEERRHVFLTDTTASCNFEITASESRRVFEIHAPGGGTVSVLYTIAGYEAGKAHGYQLFRAVNFNPWTGGELTASELFLQPPGTRDGLRSLWSKLAREWCDYSDKREIPNYYKLDFNKDWCANPSRAPLPAMFQGRSTLDELSHAYLTRDGMILRLGPYEGWYYAFGPAMLELDRAFLIRIGFDPALWGL